MAVIPDKTKIQLQKLYDKLNKPNVTQNYAFK
jgi:hypothetical protein